MHKKYKIVPKLVPKSIGAIFLRKIVPKSYLNKKTMLDCTDQPNTTGGAGDCFFEKRVARWFHFVATAGCPLLELRSAVVSGRPAVTRVTDSVTLDVTQVERHLDQTSGAQTRGIDATR